MNIVTLPTWSELVAGVAPWSSGIFTEFLPVVTWTCGLFIGVGILVIIFYSITAAIHHVEATLSRMNNPIDTANVQDWQKRGDPSGGLFGLGKKKELTIEELYNQHYGLPLDSMAKQNADRKKYQQRQLEIERAKKEAEIDKLDDPYSVGDFKEHP